MAKKKVRARIDLGSLSMSEVLPSKAELDAALGARVPNASFEKIIKSIGFYFVFAKAEHDAVAKGELARQLLRFEKIAEAVRSDFTSSKQPKLPSSALAPRNTFAAEDAAYKHLHKILAQLPTHLPPKIRAADAPTNLPKIRPPFDIVRASFFVQLLDVTLLFSRWIAAEAALKPFSKSAKGFAWEYWIVLLSAIMKRDGLPYGVNKATVNPNAAVSPFVKFVRVTQSHMPPQFQRHMHSDDALGQAIVRARKGYGVGNIDVDEFLEFFFSSLSTTRGSAALFSG